jgi:hypothetical protein
MRILNVIMIKDGVVDNITSFGVDESRVREISKEAENEFVRQARYLGFGSEGEEDDEDLIIENGYFEPRYGIYAYGIYASVCLTWSEIENPYES